MSDLFGMAATYISCLAIRHPFVDGNKRTSLASAFTFLYINGYGIEESYDLELADLIIDFLTKKVSKKDVEKVPSKLGSKVVIEQNPSSADFPSSDE